MAITIDLLRHGAAEASHLGGDAERALTPAGREAIRTLGAVLGRSGWRPDRVLASPYRRAQETAALILEAAGHTVAIETLAELLPESEPDLVLEAFDDRGLSAGHVLLVTHQPLVSRLAQALTGKVIAFGPGDLSRVAMPDGLRGDGTIEDV